MPKLTPQQIELAYTESDLRISLADALRNPLLARCLEITAEALARRAHPNEFRPPPAPSLAYDLLRPTPGNHPPPLPDFKRACAGDKDE